MRLNLQTLPNADLKTLDSLSDTFQKKVGNWAFASHFTSSSVRSEEPYGQFSIAPADAPVMSYVEQSMGDLVLPSAHLYEQALQQSMQDLQQDLEQHPSAAAALAVLQEDLELRQYFRARQLEQVYS